MTRSAAQDVLSYAYYATRRAEDRLYRAVWWAMHRRQAQADHDARILWSPPEPSPKQYGAVLDLIGLTATMKEHPDTAHYWLHDLGMILDRAAAQHPAITGVPFSDSVHIVSDDFDAVADAASDIVFQALMRNTPMLVRGLIEYGDYQLHLHPQGGRAARIHWGGLGVLDIAKKEKLLPKGAIVYLADPCPRPPSSLARVCPSACLRVCGKRSIGRRSRLAATRCNESGTPSIMIIGPILPMCEIRSVGCDEAMPDGPCT